MKIYLVTCYCRDNNATWKSKTLVKAKNAVQAWDKFQKQWTKELETGKTELTISSILEYSVEVLCSVNDVMF